MKRAVVVIIFLLFFLLLFNVSSKAMLAAVSLEELVKGADSIVIGKVKKVECKEVSKEERGKIVLLNTYVTTYVTFEVERYLKNNLGQREITIRYYGGETLSGGFLWVEDQPEFEENEKALVFIKKPIPFTNFYEVYDLFLGKFTIKDDELIIFGGIFEGRGEIPLSDALSQIEEYLNEKEK